uniref:hypothetical protein n=1 Tax=unclassified Variovorax TaxID=663243 RepID=UPI000D369827
MTIFSTMALAAAALLSFAASADEVLRIRSLSTPPASAEPQVVGLKALTATAGNTNIVFVHGIGWTQERGASEFGDDLVKAVAKGYPDAKARTSEATCTTSSLDGAQARRGKTNGLLLRRSVASTAPARLQTDDPQFSLPLDAVGCLDRVVVDVAPNRTVSIYRLLWDDAMWNGAEWFFMGYDDPVPVIDGRKAVPAGYEDVDGLRASLNSQLKNSVITYGLADAALYMSPVGALMREGVAAAICAAVSGTLDEMLRRGPTASMADLCARAPVRKEPLLLMSHSLGSRILFDTVRSDLTPLLADRIAAGTLNSAIELHMLANQLPLVALGRVGDVRSKEVIPGKTVRLVAYSEVNDLLTYELVPYFEHMYYTRCYGLGAPTNGCVEAADQAYANRGASFHRDEPARRALAGTLGFDVVDIRLRFAPNKIPFVAALKDPGVAHSGHLASDSAVSILLCGVQDGQPRSPLSACREQ